MISIREEYLKPFNCVPTNDPKGWFAVKTTNQLIIFLIQKCLFSVFWPILVIL